LVGVFMLLL